MTIRPGEGPLFEIKKKGDKKWVYRKAWFLQMIIA
jgi:hypothetical protein